MRAPARVAAVGLLALALLAASLVQGGAAAALRHSVDPSSRGVYDILVTAADAGATRPTVLPPNALGGSGTAMQMADVEALRALAGVEVAAPIAQLLLPVQQGWRMQLAAAVDPEQLTPSGESYRATLRLLSDDGLGERVLSEESYMVALDQSNAPPDVPTPGTGPESGATCNIGDVAIDCSLFEWGFEPNRTAAWVLSDSRGELSSGQSDGRVVTVALPLAFALDQRMTLIDPVAEQALLGDAGAFLTPLVELGGTRGRSTEELGAWGSANTGSIAKGLEEAAENDAAYRLKMEQGPAYQEYLRVKRERGEPARLADYFGNPQPMYPVLVAETPTLAPLRAELSIESFGPITLPGTDRYGEMPAFPTPLLNGSAGTPAGTLVQDISELLDVSSYAAVPVLWPGAGALPSGNDGESYAGYIGLGGAVLVDESTPDAVHRGADGVYSAQLDGVGFRTIAVPSGGSSGLSTQADPSAPGAESAYSEPRAAERPPLGEGFETGASVGSFSADELNAVIASADGIPLGAYEPVDAVLVEDADGEPVPPTPITPTLSGFGLLGARTSIIGDIRRAGWQDDVIVEAVRVRVAGVERYDAAGIAAVSAAARDIEELGYTATLVPGSHSETVNVNVGGYAFGTTDAAAEQRVGELGVVEQRWTVLGPAAALSSAVGTGMMLLLNTVLLAVLGLLALTELGAIPARRREAATLRELGWKRQRIARWYAGEQLLGLLLVVGVGAIALVAAPERAVAAPVVGAVVIGAALIFVTATVRATRPSAERVVSVEALERSFDVEYRPEARIAGGASHGNDVGDRGAASAPRAQRKLPGSAVSWGLQRAWRRPAAALPMGFAVFTAMATVAAFALAMAEISGPGAQAPVGGQILAAVPQLLLALCGAGVAGVLVVRSRGQSAREGRSLRAVLEATGWPNEDQRRATLAASLAVTLASVLLGSYLLWFALGALGVTSENAIVSSALAAGIVVAGLLLVPLPAWRGSSRFMRKAVAPDGDAA